MPRGPTYIDSKGACIYCGATNVALSDEHVVPYSLGGSHVLRKASCNRCSDITKKFEQKVARDLWGDARTAFDAPSRRKRQRKKELVMPDPDGQKRGLVIAAEEYPAGFVFYKMCQAGLLQGLSPDIDVSRGWQFVVIDDDKRKKNFLEKYPERKLSLRFRHVPHEFGQLLAKVGYGHILTQLDLEDFQPICVPYILGNKTNISYVVGGTFEEQAPEQDNGYSLRTAGFGSIDRMMLVALIRLLANTHAPAYHVVVGDVSGAARVQRVMQKLGEITITEESGLNRSDMHSPINHWMPQVQPLPYWIDK